MTLPLRQIRVMHVLNELRMSGAEVMLRDGIARWDALGVTSDVVATGRRRGPFADQLERAGARVYHLPFTPRATYLAALRRLLRDGAYHVLHVHTERANFWYALVGVSLPGVAVVRTVHSVFAFGGVLRSKRALQRHLLRLGGVRTISVGAAVEGNERQRFGHPTTLLPNWIDTSRFAPPATEARIAARRWANVGDQQIAITSVGNCRHAKNHAAILGALARLGTAHDWVYLHAGEEAEDAHEQLLARELGIADRCRFLGPTSDVVRVLHASDVYVMPSRYEGSSIAALEAVATGLPAVLADVPGLDEVRRSVRDGIVWVTPTPAAVRDGLRQAINLAAVERDEERQVMHQGVLRGHGIDAGVGRYHELYRQLVRGPKGQGR